MLNVGDIVKYKGSRLYILKVLGIYNNKYKLKILISEYLGLEKGRTFMSYNDLENFESSYVKLGDKYSEDMVMLLYE